MQRITSLVPSTQILDLAQQAIHTGNVGLMKTLLKGGFKVNSLLSNNETALSFACRKGSIDIVELLLAQPDIDKDQNMAGMMSPLSVAVEGGHLKIVQMLVESGANINGGDAMAPLTVAIMHQQWDIIKYLMERDVDYTTMVRNISPIIAAVQLRYLPLVRTILSKCKVVDLAVLKYAVLFNHSEVYYYLFFNHSTTLTYLLPISLLSPSYQYNFPMQLNSLLE